MRRRITIPLVIVLFLIAVTSWLQPSARAVSATPLRVLSWNIAFGKGTDNVTNYDRIATWLARMNPDLIALCEMPPDQIPTLLTLLTQKTGRSWFSHFVPKAEGIAEGNLILSKFNFSSTSSRYLSSTRSVAQVTVNVGGRNVNFFATHLDHTSSSLRLTQAQELIDWTASFAAPRIVCGDMNAGNDTPEILHLLASYRDGWVDALNQGTASAYPDNPVWMNTRTRRWRIDFILYAGDTTNLTARSANIPDTRDLGNTNVVVTLGTLDDRGVRPSDHNLVVADFDVISTGAPPPAPVTPPVLLVQPNTDRAIALHSVLFKREPFVVNTPLNLSSDHRTRIMLFAANLELQSGETPSAITVRGVDSRGNSYDLPVEQVLKFSNLPGLSTLIVKLPADTTINGDLRINVGIHSAVSNNVFVAIQAQ
ncbi:MAG TPA: endonuclease/exonuclease/phosphatase family protein [Pyrinomonadaceae bacterium]|nr:endonuclease/exonuclease/phosphatase family protein [Pyrinomonadaceae bacterium]